jgi:hypothetical protein
MSVAQARPHDLEAWWTLDDGELEERTGHGSSPGLMLPRSDPVLVPWAPHLVLSVAKDALLQVVEHAYRQRQQRRLCAPDGYW